VALLSALAIACTSTPPTITPVPEGATGEGATSIEIPIDPPPGATAPVMQREASPITIGELAPYRDAGGAFSMDLPLGWPEQRQQTTSTDVKLGTLFQAPEYNGLISITQFDSGQVPASVGATANQVLEMTGVMDQPGYVELGRETVIEREGEAMRVEVAYSRSDGVDMHSLVLFQIDGTTFSMVHVGVENGSWAENEGRIRDILATYRVPAAGG
jgi:hypothetical protein